MTASDNEQMKETQKDRVQKREGEIDDTDRETHANNPAALRCELKASDCDQQLSHRLLDESLLICSFRGSVTHGLALEVGETVQILEKCEGWYRGFSTRKPNVKGVFPVSYVHLKKAIVVNRGPNETVVPLEDPIVTEVTSTLQEWALLWKQLYVMVKMFLTVREETIASLSSSCTNHSRGNGSPVLVDVGVCLLLRVTKQSSHEKHKVDLFYKVRHVMMELIDLRRQLLSGHLTQDQSRDVKRHITVRLDWGNEHLGLDLVPRKEFEMVDEDQISVSDLYKMIVSERSWTITREALVCVAAARFQTVLIPKHLSSRHSVQQSTTQGDSTRRHGEPCRVPVPHHLLVNLKSFTYNSIGEDTDIFFSLYDLREGKTIRCNNENEWHQIHENIIRKSSTKYTAPSTNYGLIISLQLLRGDMEQVRRENPLIFSRGVAVTRKLGFPDVIMPGDVRNDLYLTLERGDFERGGKSVQKNIEVTVYVLYADGEILKDCICLGSGEPSIPEHRSFVLYHNNSPRWSEVIKLPIPIDRFRGSHLRFEFRHCSTKDKGEKKLFGFAFTPLMREDGTTLSDESHELYVYKCDENTTFSNHALYLGLPCCKDDFNSCPSIPSSLIFQRSTKETFWISTQLSSTKLTQNVDLLALLKWKAHPDRVMDILGRLRHVSGEEIVKFLQDILDTLFSILDDNTDKYGPLVFQSLVFIINLLRDSKYYHFRPVMDTYIQKHFAGALAYKSFDCSVLGFRELIRCLKWYMDRSAEVVRQDHIQEAMRALEYLFKFIVQSRILYSRATCGMEEEQFRTSIQELFQSIRFVLSLDSRNSETLIFTQGSQPCPGTIQAPGPCAGPAAAPLALAPTLYQAQPPSPGQAVGSGQANCTQAWSSSALRSPPLSAALLNSFPAIFDELLQMFTVQEVAEFVRGTLGSMPSTVHIGQSMDVVKLQSIARTVDSRLFSFPESRRILLPVVLHHIHLHLRQQKELLICSGILSSIFSIIKTSSLDTSVQEEVEMMVESLLDVLLQTLLSIMSKSQSQEAGEYVSCLLSLLRQMTDIHFQHLMENFQSKDELKEFLLKILCVFRNLMKLSIFPRDWNVMRLLTSKYGDMRVMMTYELFSMWQNLGENKIHFIPGMIGPFLGVTLVPQVEVRNIMIPIFHDMMDWEQRKNGNFKQFRMIRSVIMFTDECFTRLSAIMLFVCVCVCVCVRVCAQVEAELIDKLDSLVSEGKGDENYRELFGLLDCMKGDETENKKIGCTVNLLAAFTLLLYWELLHWDERPLKEFLHYPAQTEWHRKEGLCRKVIHYFNKGKKMEAAYYDNIMEQQRLEPEFFRVGFYGRKFPFFLRNNGHDYERLEAFQQRMLGEFPQAIAMQHPNQPDEAILQCDAHSFFDILGSDLQIYAVTPVPDSIGVLQMDRVPDRIKSFYRVNNVLRFRYDRPFHKGPKDRDNEFKSLWIERTTLILTHPLPGISRWFEVEKRELVEVSPLENAVSVVENKNQELRTLISQYQHKQLHGNINLLSMTLNGVIDAAVNGGIARYQEAFFDKEYITSHPEDTEKITQLKDLMQEQVHILGVGLAVHEKLVHPEMRPLHKKLIDQFQMMRSSLCHGLPGLDKATSGANTSRGILASHSPMSPDSFKLVHRHSPTAVLTPVRNSSSSLSSQNSSEMGNVGNLLILADGVVVEHAEDFYRMQASPSSSSLSSTHSAPSQMMNSAPSTIRVSSPSLPDKYRHNREMLMLLPPHKDRPSSAMYTNVIENGQPVNFQRALFHQVIGPCKPCSDPNLSVAEKVLTTPSSWSLDSGTREALPFLSAHVGSVLAPPVPPRSLPHGQHLLMHFDAFHHQSPLHPIPASPTSPQSILDGSNSTLSGSASSGVSSLSESNFGGPPSSSDPPASRTNTLESVPSSQAWTTDQEDLDSPYQPVRYSISEPDVLDVVKPPPCRSHSAPGGVTPAQAGAQIQPQIPGLASVGALPQHLYYQHHFHPHYIPHHPPLYHLHEPPPALPPKYLREGCIPEEDPLNPQSPPPPPAPRPMPRKISQPIIAAAKDEQAKVAWEHGISEE
ncbi:Dedicator of cytokinesis protein 3 Modifier of cell adhesion Presenilin-binding protein [Channa argus]|uniref:Dedicator of cytokinesis protein 3 Modifier of cell adhesion Presenilin-binding protein n=1 Tax=Channa argus TaxID=215402 RepID=A0A6G1PJL9_CHAAH|nr:Dedicator of cytokinesis protein 3 Modifier of cell adhesion Presenilin-binding protein [Channa argus]